MPIAYSYKRFSSDAQEGNDSIRRQTAAAQRFVEEHPEYSLVLDTTLTLVDAGISAYTGRNIKSGALGIFIDAVKDKVIPEGSWLLLESFDRFTRQKVNIAANELLNLINHGIVVVTLHNETIYRSEDFENSDGMVNLLGAMIAMQGHHSEQVTKGKRVTEAWKAKYSKLASEQHIITKLVPFWLKVNSTRTGFELLEERVKVVQEIFKKRANGHGKSKIANDLTLGGVPTPKGMSSTWHASTVNKILMSDAAIGTLTNNKGERYTDYFPKIIDEAIFQNVQAIRQQPASVGKTIMAHPLTGLVKHDCGTTMRRINKGTKAGGEPKFICPHCKLGLPFKVALQLVEQALDNSHYVAAPTLQGEEIFGLEQVIGNLEEEINEAYAHFRKVKTLEARQLWEKLTYEKNTLTEELLTKRGSNTEVLLALEEAAIERARKAGKLISCLRSVTKSAHFSNKFTKLTLKTISGKVVLAEDFLPSDNFL